MGQWIVGGILLLIVVAILWNLIRKRKSGESSCSCGGGCGSCASHGMCHPSDSHKDR